MTGADDLLHHELERLTELDPRDPDLAGAHELTYVVHSDITYRYPAPIHGLCHRLVVVPRHRHGDQRRLAHRIAVSAVPWAAIRHRRDRFGNPVVDIEVPAVPERITFHSRVVVRRRREHHRDLRWPVLHATAGDLTAVDDALDRAAAAIQPSSAGVALADAICHTIHDEMTYEFGATTVRTTAAQAWAQRRGVCQDLAHVMVVMCRARGLDARYVSGHLLGEGATHAWTEVLDPTTGATVALDPTHDRRTDLRYVTVAVGRDYRDVAPTAGRYVGRPGGTLTTRKRVAVVQAA